MSKLFAGRTVAITGAAGGIGQCLCRHFGEQGAAIAAIDLNAKVLALPEQLGVSGITATAAVVDVRDAEAVRRVFDGMGEVHILVCNAGVAHFATLAQTDPAGWQADIDANLNGSFNCAHAVLPQMVERKGGNIVTIGSVNSLVALGHPGYSAAKAGMISMTRSIALEYGRYGIRANVVLPGTVRTPIWDDRVAKDPRVLDTLERWYPLGRIIEPEEVAQVVAFLASDLASAVTGVAVPVDCGLMAGNIVMAHELTLEDF